MFWECDYFLSKFNITAKEVRKEAKLIGQSHHHLHPDIIFTFFHDFIFPSHVTVNEVLKTKRSSED